MPRPLAGRGPFLVLALVAAIALLLAGWHYLTADDAVLPVRTVAQLTPVPITISTVRVGLEELPVQANGYLISQTYDVAGPFLRPAAAYALVSLLGVAVAYFLAVISGLARPAFVVGMALVIFLLMSLNADLLGVVDAGQQYFLVGALAALGLPAYYLHAFRPEVSFGIRLLLFAGLVAGLGAVLFGLSPTPAAVTALHLSGFFTVGGAVAFAALVLWVGFENVHGLLWLNTQAATPAGRFGLLPFVLASSLYLGTLLLYYWNNGEVLILPGLRLDPLLLLLPAVVVGWLGLRRRAATYGAWVPYWPGMAHLYLVLVLLGAAALGYALATANDPLLQAARDFTARALLCLGAAFLVYVLLNFAPLLRQKLPVYRVVYEPRRFPFYAMMGLGLALLGLVEMRNNFFVADQVRAGYYNNLGDLARLLSELNSDDLSQALLAERYYAESDLLDQHNHKASLGRAALYRFRLQRQNEINILRRALNRRPSEKISLRLAALYNEPTDFFDRLRVLREALKVDPASARLNGDLAQLYTRSALTDSVAFYQSRAEATAPHDAVLQANRLAQLIQQQQWQPAQNLAQATAAVPDDALRSNALLAAQLTSRPAAAPTQLPLPADSTLTPAGFARLYHAGLSRAQRQDTSALPALARLTARPENAAYIDQLTFLRAVTQHYGGRSVAAQATLLPLATGSGPSTAYYQQLQGLWLLDQHLPAPAAGRLAEARANGADAAALPAAYALALSNQPDSARRVARQAAQGRYLPAILPARRLLAVLDPDFRASYPQAPDSLKAQFLVLRGDELPAAELLPAAVALPAGPVREAALLAQVPRALRAGRLAEVQQVIQQFAPAPATRTPAASAWNVLRGETYVRARQWAPLRQLLQNATFRGPQRAYALYFQAALAEADQQPAEAARLYAQLVQQAPFVEAGLLAAADFYTRRRDYAAAYNTLLRGIEYNPESAALLQAYVLASVPVGLTEYAAAPLEHLGALLSPADYATFQAQYEARRAARAAAAPWN
ncbi:tetratricopeptide repeat protein [Hymenobacter weizhouensis]|uniref:tetratricopeptide repeat protein n=1 Tax=Hymenobacter sp. YIM 151500-1 TaxID=2987689 RepID=UPI002226860D|nr:hypothetical protein [Hymenobacter sp. YIM 151500-1]UYZ63277.1 hypothetical protein OIS53_00170 [Hymenobacter sp. YIM 151500-1]